MSFRVRRPIVPATVRTQREWCFTLTRGNCVIEPSHPPTRSKNAFRVFLCAVLILCLFPAVPRAQQLNFYSVREKDGLPQKQVTAICQDSSGFVWLGSMTGLIRTDGVSFDTVPLGEQYRGVSISCLTMLEDRRLLIGTHTMGPLILGEKGCLPLVDDPAIARARVNSVLIGETGDILLALETGLYSFREGIALPMTTEPGLNGAIPTALYRDAKGVLWIGSDQGLFRQEGTQLIPVRYAKSVFDPRVNTIIADAHGTLYCGTNSGLFRIDGDQAVRLKVAHLPETALYFVTLQDADGNLWFGTSHGAVCLDHAGFSAYDDTNGLCHNMVRALFMDREKNLWLGTNDGYSVLRPGAFITYGREEAIGQGGVDDIFEDSKGRLWIAADTDGITVLDGERRFRIAEEDGLPSNFVYAIGEDIRGRMIIGTRYSISIWDQGRITVLRNGTAVTTMFTDRDRRVWIGMRRGVLLWNGESLIDPFPGADLQQTGVSTITEDRDRQLWFGTRSAGVFVWNGHSFAHYNRENGFTDASVWQIAFDRRGIGWFGTNGDGVYRFDGKQFTVINGGNGLASNFVWQVLADREDILWFSTNAGLQRYDGSTFRLLTTDDGLADNEGSVGACLEDSTGRKWFGSSSGLSLLQARVPPAQPFDPILFMRRIMNGEQEVSVRPGEVYEFSQAPLSFEYTAQFFRNPQALVFRHKLEGYDTDWSPPSRERSLNVRGLPPGTYTLVVQAGYNGQWSTRNAAIPFVIHPPFYLNWWFILSAVTGVVGIAALVIRGRILKNRREKMLLERRVEERTRDLKEANNELSAFNTAVSNNLRVPVRHIHGYCDLLQATAGNQASEQVKRYIGKIREGALRMESLIDDLLGLADAGSQEIRFEPVNLSLYARLILKELAEQQPERTVDIAVEDGVIAHGSDKLLHLALELLIDNAWKFTRVREVAHISFGVRNDNGEHVYCVRDNGIGLPPIDSEQLFQPFSQLNSGDDYPGTGLGLFTVRRIVTRHGGRVWAEGTPDSGATFCFTLPAPTPSL